jgi:hypothetical protein
MQAFLSIIGQVTDAYGLKKQNDGRAGRTLEFSLEPEKWRDEPKKQINRGRARRSQRSTRPTDIALRPGKVERRESPLQRKNPAPKRARFFFPSFSNCAELPRPH